MKDAKQSDDYDDDDAAVHTAKISAIKLLLVFVVKILKL